MLHDSVPMFLTCANISILTLANSRTVEAPAKSAHACYMTMTIPITILESPVLHAYTSAERDTGLLELPDPKL